MLRRIKSGLIVLLLSWNWSWAGISSPPGASTSEVWLLEIDGVINPLSARYLQHHLEAAQRNPRPKALILELNTPGGLESSMREMIQAILNSPVPVIVYVAPPGARAASAGMFITAAAHFAAMAPGTNIGAAHPVSIGSEQEKAPSAVEEKAVNDAAALARSIGLERGRNSRWLEAAVRQSVSVTATEAQKLDVVDWVISDRDELIKRLHGQAVVLPTGKVVLNTLDAEVIEKPMNLAEKALQAITDPNIAYLLMTIGFVAIMAELYGPGTIIPGITGTISLVLAFAALGSLPFNWAGIILLALGVGLLIFELQSEGFGFLGVAALLTFTLGSLILYRPWEPVSPSLPQVGLNPWLLAGVTAFVVGFMFFVLRAVLRSRHLPVATGMQAMIGQTGIVSAELAPAGRVKVGTEEWTAVIATDPLDKSSKGLKMQTIPAGQPVEVIGVEGVTLKVRPKRLGHRLQAS